MPIKSINKMQYLHYCALAKAQLGCVDEIQNFCKASGIDNCGNIDNVVGFFFSSFEEKIPEDSKAVL